VSCYFRHLKDVLAEAGVEVTQANKKDVDQAILEIVGVAYKEDTDRVTAVLKEIGKEMLEDDAYKEFILEPLEILGVDKFADSAVIVKARIKTVPIKQWFVGREMNRRIKKRFDEEAIEIPFPHRTFYFGDASRSVAVALQGQKEDREALKDVLRELLEEAKA